MPKFIIEKEIKAKNLHEALKNERNAEVYKIFELDEPTDDTPKANVGFK